MKSKDYTLKIVGERAVNGVKTVALSISHPFYPEAVIYFDKDNGLLVKSELKVNLQTPKDEFQKLLQKEKAHTLEIFFDDYKPFDGILHFTKVKMRIYDRILKVKISELKLLKKYDSKAFKKPE